MLHCKTGSIVPIAIDLESPYVHGVYNYISMHAIAKQSYYADFDYSDERAGLVFYQMTNLSVIHIHDIV